MFVNMGFSIFEAYPGNNISAPLDKNSQGLYAGEGAGVLVLKRYADAVRDGDRIHAIVRGGGLSNDGKGVFVLAPNTKGQVLAYERAYADAGVDPATVQFVECHATGTPVGDGCRQVGVSEATFYQWKKKFAHLGVNEVRRVRQLEDENARLKRLVADLTLDKHMLAEALRKKV